MKMYKWEWYVEFSRSEKRDVAQGWRVRSKGAFDPHPYSIVRAG